MNSFMIPNHDIFLDSTITISNIGTWGIDIVTRKLNISKEIYSILNIKEDESINDIDQFIKSYVAPEFQRKMSSAIKLAIRSGKFSNNEYELISTDKISKWVIIKGTSVVEEGSSITKLIGSLIDVTELKRKSKLIEERTSFLDTVIQSMINPLYYKDDKGLYQYCNDAFCQLIGVDKKDIIGKSSITPLLDDVTDNHSQTDAQLMKSKSNQVFETKIKLPDGMLRDVVFHKSIHLNSEKQVIGLIGVIIDITSQKNYEKHILKESIIKDSILRLYTLVSSEEIEINLMKSFLSEMVLSLEDVNSGKIIDFTSPDNVKIIAYEGYENSDIENFNSKNISCSLIDIEFKRNSSPRIVSDFKSKKSCDYIVTNTGIYPETSILIPIILDDVNLIISLESNKKGAFSQDDIIISKYIQTEFLSLHMISELNRKTYALSRYDSLTGFMNRGFFNSVLDSRIELAKRNKELLAIVLFDLDGLKIVNDTYGHEAGDLYIRAFSNQIYSFFRKSDNFARIGGDEFIGIFSTTDADSLQSKIKIFKETFSLTPINYSSKPFRGRFSFGISIYPNDSLSTDFLIKIADDRMYIDKKATEKEEPIKYHL
ncbi:MAG: diguanylate cyclase [Clostridia bacterium]|nr:diguanylate cyclase [Clostridia bacterium]